MELELPLDFKEFLKLLNDKGVKYLLIGRETQTMRYNEKNRRVAMTQFDRIAFDTNVMGGRACIRGMRVTVSLILNLIANGMTSAEILKEYSYLEEEDVRQALQYAAWLADETVQILESV